MRDAIKHSLDAYATDGVPTGGFLRAVLEHQSVWVVFARADEENARDMREILTYIWNELPGNCHGSPEVVRAWLDHFARALEVEAEVAAAEAAVDANVAEGIVADGGGEGVTPDERGSVARELRGIAPLLWKAESQLGTYEHTRQCPECSALVKQLRALADELEAK